MGLLFFVGFLAIICVALGIIYVQQGVKQRDLEAQINKLSLTLLKPLPSAEKLQTEYDDAERSVSPLTPKAALDIIVGIAAESGIDVDPDRDKFRIPQGSSAGKETVGEGNYEILSFKSIKAQGDYDSVMAFLSNLESGERLKTLVLKSVTISQVELKISEEEKARVAEYYNVSSAVIAMMTDNAIAEIPNPINFAGGAASNDMTAFPDVTATLASKGADSAFVTAAIAVEDITAEVLGYLLYGNQLVTDVDGDGTYDAADDSINSVNYVTMTETKYYYTCEVDGTVRQWDGSDVATATEYLISAEQARVAEFNDIQSAVIAMMTDNAIAAIPNPAGYATGVAQNQMSFVSDTLNQGFPDFTTTAAEKGYTGTGTPRNGYALYKHNKIDPDDTTAFSTVSYVSMAETKWYYTCEANGTVRQWDRPDVATATEYPSSEQAKIETVATLNVDIYTKSGGEHL